MAAEGMRFLWLWNGGTIFLNLGVIWGMSNYMREHPRLRRTEYGKIPSHLRRLLAELNGARAADLAAGEVGNCILDMCYINRPNYVSLEFAC